MKRLITICCLLVLAEKLHAQDPHFSQFFASPLTLNPAFTGKFDGEFRVAGNYRNQWPTIYNAFITTTGSVDFHVGKNSIAPNDTWGVGAMFYSDNSANGAVKSNYAGISTAYHKGLDEEGYHQIGLGFQATYANMNIYTQNLKFEDQLTNAGFTGVTSEIFNYSTLSTKYFDMNAGVLYTGSTSDRNFFYFGISLYHINRPKQKLTGAEYILNPRATFQAGTYFGISDNATLHFSGLQTFQGGASETLLGGAVQLTANPDVPKPTSLYLGTWVRFNDALIPYVGIEYDDFRLGVTYDVNTSTLKTASQKQGGIEVSLIYALRKSTDHPVNCPKF
ncbi:PorP/SprF family type IX secretion system membrane protein [Chitinophagaceae bacterium LWZ2-11]